MGDEGVDPGLSIRADGRVVKNSGGEELRRCSTDSEELGTTRDGVQSDEGNIPIGSTSDSASIPNPFRVCI